jgi:hypothetical protein
MRLEVITKDDLQSFRMQLLNDIRQLLTPQEAMPIKSWLKNSEVRKLLGISSTTVQRLRVAGKLRSTKLGGVHYYRYEDIEKLLDNHTA